MTRRDLKPSNILVDAAGEPKVIDFGVARATDSDLAVTTLTTESGALIGTLQYMSPEQCAADRSDLDARSDVYALGAVLYELLCGEVPYELNGLPIPEAARVIRDETPAPPSTVNRTLRGEVETIALKAIEKNRERRYPSAGAIGEDIGRYLRGEAIEARRPSAIYRVRSLARRHRVATAVILVLAVLGPVLVLATMEAVRWRRAQETDLSTAERVAAGRSWVALERDVDQAVTAYMREHDVPGATVAITKHGRLIHDKGYGFADAWRKTQMEPWHRSRTRVVGNTLVITPALLMLLESRPEVDLDTPLYGPDGIFGDAFRADIETGIENLAAGERNRQRAWYRAMTIRHLLTGSAGFERGLTSDESTARKYGPLDPGVTMREMHRELLRDHALESKPGSQWSKRFPEPDRALIGLAMTTLAGEPYAEYVEDHLLEPLGLLGAVVPEGTAMKGQDALPHRRRRGRVVADEVIEVAAPRPASANGGWVASARDLARLIVAMDGLAAPPDILSSEAIAETQRLASTADDRPFLCSWWVGTNSRGHRKFWRSSKQEGGANYIVMFPDGYISHSGVDLSGVAIAVCVNIKIESIQGIEAELTDGLSILVGETSIPESFDLWRDP